MSCRFDGALPLLLPRLDRLLDVSLPELHDRKHFFDHKPLCDDALEFIEDDVHGIDFTAPIRVDDFLRDLAGSGEGVLADHADMLVDDLDLSLAFARRRLFSKLLL